MDAKRIRSLADTIAARAGDIVTRCSERQTAAPVFAELIDSVAAGLSEEPRDRRRLETLLALRQQITQGTSA